MRAVFVETSEFSRTRERYLDDDRYRILQDQLIVNPLAGVVIPGTGGLRKLRFADTRRAKGKRGGLRVIYYFWLSGPEFWMMKLYDKDEAPDLTHDERRVLREELKICLASRTGRER